MKLYFENSIGQRRVIANPQTENEAYEIIDEFCEERNFKIYYIRTWRDDNGLKIFDVGSHTEFFILDDKEWGFIMTYGDFVRNMNDEELAKFITTLFNDSLSEYGDSNCILDEEFESDCLTWLKSQIG